MVPTAIRICVIGGSCADMLPYNSAKFGTTNVTRKMISPMTSTTRKPG